MQKTIRVALLQNVNIFSIYKYIYIYKIYEFKETKLILKNFEISSNFWLGIQFKSNLNCWTSCQFVDQSCINFYSPPSQNKERKKKSFLKFMQLFSRLETRHCNYHASITWWRNIFLKACNKSKADAGHHRAERTWSRRPGSFRPALWRMPAKGKHVRPRVINQPLWTH